MFKFHSLYFKKTIYFALYGFAISFEPDVVAHTYNPCTDGAQAGRSQVLVLLGQLSGDPVYQNKK